VKLQAEPKDMLRTYIIGHFHAHAAKATSGIAIIMYEVFRLGGLQYEVIRREGLPTGNITLEYTTHMQDAASQAQQSKCSFAAPAKGGPGGALR
jgi:hypothetical protein